MADLININTDEAKKKLLVVRQFTQELFLLVSMGVSFILFTKYDKLSQEFRTYNQNDTRELIKTVSKNTEVVERNTAVFSEVIQLLKDNNNKNDKH